jgi:predicted TIM-barrel fold metal-dependent hydrolase
VTPARVVDVHAHVFPDDVAARAMPALEEEAGVTASFDGTVAGLLAEVERAGIDEVWTMPVATKPDQVTAINDWAATTAGDRVRPFGAMHPDLPDPAREIARMVGLGLPGFKMHSEYQRFAPDEERLAPLWRAAADAGMVVLFHAGIDIGIPTLRGTPSAFAAFAEAHPDLTAILAHMGGFKLWDEVLDMLAGSHLFLDTSYTLGHLPDDEFVALVAAHGPDRVLFGTDGPWTDMAREVERMRGLGLPEADLEAIMGGNAGRLLPR